MSLLFDTNVVSEWLKPQPDPRAVAWLAQVDEDDVFLSVVTLTELRYGIDRMPKGRRRDRIDQWLNIELSDRFAGRIIAVDGEIALACGHILAEREAIGRPMEVMDALIAATAQSIGLSLVTRNESDFFGTVREIINPWSSA